MYVISILKYAYFTYTFIARKQTYVRMAIMPYQN